MVTKVKTGIVFEGGAFRTIFSCGVMDALVENDIMPDYMIGVSAGAAYGVSMASKQPRRNLDVLMKYRNDKSYLGLSNMIDKDNKSIYGLEFSYETIPNELNLFDYDAFKQYKGDFYCVVTNLLTGQPEYMKYTGDDRTNTVLKATCALPMLFPPIIINDVPYMDGGLSDSIPYLKAIEDGCDRIIVVLTRQSGYTKTTSRSTKAIAYSYRNQYPKLTETMLTRASRYNESLKGLDQYVKEGRIITIQPTTSKGFSRLEKDKNKILSMYNDGYNQCYELLDTIKEFYGIK